MRCEYCDTPVVAEEEPENVALMMHMQESQPCSQQFEYHLENLRSSWTPSMSGG